MSTNMNVTQATIANRLGITNVTVCRALKGRAAAATIEAVRKVAEEIHYENRNDPAVRERKAQEMAAAKYYWGGNFHTVEEERQRMTELRAEGYSNKQIAHKIGRAPLTVRRAIGPQDPEMSKLNRQLGVKVVAMKNAARKKFVHEAPIRAYNKKVAEHNKKKAEVMAMEAELTAQTAKIEMIAAATPPIPAVNIQNLKPTTLM